VIPYTGGWSARLHARRYLTTTDRVTCSDDRARTVAVILITPARSARTSPDVPTEATLSDDEAQSIVVSPSKCDRIALNDPTSPTASASDSGTTLIVGGWSAGGDTESFVSFSRFRHAVKTKGRSRLHHDGVRDDAVTAPRFRRDFSRFFSRKFQSRGMSMWSRIEGSKVALDSVDRRMGECCLRSFTRLDLTGLMDTEFRRLPCSPPSAVHMQQG